MSTFTKEEYAAIGEMIVEAASVDKAMAPFIQQSASVSVEGLTHMTMGDKLTKLSSCVGPCLRTDDSRLQFDELVDRFRATIKKRDIVVHGTWKVEVVPGTFNSAPFNTQVLGGPTRTVTATLRQGSIDIQQVKRLTTEFSMQRQKLIVFYLGKH